MPELPPTNLASPDPDRTSAHTGSAAENRDDVAPGTVIAGKYKLLEPIGEGGMGAVWLWRIGPADDQAEFGFSAPTRLAFSPFFDEDAASCKTTSRPG